jgi:hypothetical protein
MSFENREKSAETKFSIDQQKQFKIEARASKLIGLWAAEQMHITGTEAESYAKSVVAANMDEPGFDDVRRKLVADFKEHHIEASDHLLETVFAKKLEEATAQIEAEAQA